MIRGTYLLVTGPRGGPETQYISLRAPAGTSAAIFLLFSAGLTAAVPSHRRDCANLRSLQPFVFGETVSFEQYLCDFLKCYLFGWRVLQTILFRASCEL